MSFDSVEEEWFSEWLGTAEKRGLVESIIYHPSSFLLSERQSLKVTKHLKTKTKTIDKFLLHPHKYTPDFVFYKRDPLDQYPHDLIDCNKGIVFVDVKGAFSGGRNNNSSITFPISQKWVYDKYKVFVNKVVPEKFFHKTFVPKSIAYGKRGQLLKRWSGCTILE